METRTGSYTRSMSIRRVTKADWQAFRQLRLRALTADPDAFGETLVEALGLTDDEWQARADPPDGVVFLADGNDGPVAMAMGGPAPGRPDTAGLYGMWVAPEMRGQGLGPALIDAVEDWARSAGYASIGLGVTVGNVPAIRLYKKQGFDDIGDRHPLREGTDMLIQIMGKSL
jgi:ribosomal protein S18 acetylase RimI-like enzyme